MDDKQLDEQEPSQLRLEFDESDVLYNLLPIRAQLQVDMWDAWALCTNGQGVSFG